MKKSKKTFYVMLHNNMDRADDQAIRVKAHTVVEAKEIASEYRPHRFTVGIVCTRRDFKKRTGWSTTWTVEI